MSVDAAAVVVARALVAQSPIFLVGDHAFIQSVVQIPWSAAESSLRAWAVPGAALLVLGGSSQPGENMSARDRILRRSPAWGLNAIWLGDGEAPNAGLAIGLSTTALTETLEQLFALAETKALDAASLAPMIVDCTDEVCVTCSDEGRLGEVVEPPVSAFMPAQVRTADGIEEVDVTLVGDVRVHDLVLIHAGGAIALIEEPRAKEVTGASA